jgi:protein-disulfide isomerase
MNRNAGPLKLAVPVNKIDHIVGPETAKVILVQYGDFECPTCGQAYPAVKMLLTKFEHRLRFVFRHFPLTAAHPHAEQLELDLVRFDFELSDQVYRQRVNEHVDSGKRSGVRSMPALFVNGLLVDVSFGLDHLHDAIHAKLKE